MKLTSGFRAEKASDFWAVIADCEESIFKSSAPNSSPVAQIYTKTQNKENKEKEFHETDILLKNYPNPFRDETNIEYTLPDDTKVSLYIYSLEGKQMAALVNNEIQTKGSHQVTFQSANLSGGIYLIVLQTDQQIHTKKIAMLPK